MKLSFDGQIKNPLSLNLYTYSANNPIFFIDPSGHEYGLVSGFVHDYNGTVKYGTEVVGWAITYKYANGSKKTEIYQSANKLKIMVS